MHKYIKTKTVLGSGTYGEVTKAFVRNPDGSAGRAVAVKKLFLQKQATEGLDVTALRDIKFLRELCHPNVIEVPPLGGRWRALKHHLQLSFPLKPKQKTFYLTLGPSMILMLLFFPHDEIAR
jgi:serine/threonine protein kinase